MCRLVSNLNGACNQNTILLVASIEKIDARMVFFERLFTTCVIPIT